jgi:hypothetical protein
MQTEQVSAAPEFAGTKKQQDLARRIFAIFQARGRFFAANAPIRMPRSMLIEFMQQQESGKHDWKKEIDAALNASSAVFAREEVDDDVIFVTTRGGRVAGSPAGDDTLHTLAKRFADPEPKRALPPRKKSEPGATIIFPEPSGLPALEPEWQRAEPPSRVTVPDLPELVPLDLEPELADEVIAELPTVAAAVDPDSVSDDELAEAIRTSLANEIAVARWGDAWMAEDRVQRFSRGDLRRIEDFIREQGGLAADDEIAQDVLSARPTAAEYPATRFAVNYRLSRENREFEYLGTDTAGTWALVNLPSIGTTKRKPAEIGQDYRFLLDYRVPDPELEEGIVEHVLSFYEYTYGVLPLDANLATILPRAGFSEQRAARLTFESPQATDETAAELRFPTGNRGGFVAGLEQFFAENLVPGAVFTIEKTDRPAHYLIEYFRTSAEDRKLLHLDERKSKYAFRSTTYYCATQDDFVLSESRFPKLADAKPLDERVRRRPDQVVVATFERAGENVGSSSEPRYWAVFTDLLAAANIERPISAEFLRDILTSGTYPEFSADESTEDAYFYQPVAA